MRLNTILAISWPLLGLVISVLMISSGNLAGCQEPMWVGSCEWRGLNLTEVQTMGFIIGGLSVLLIVFWSIPALIFALFLGPKVERWAKKKAQELKDSELSDFG